MTGAADGAATAVWYWPLFRQHTVAARIYSNEEQEYRDYSATI